MQIIISNEEQEQVGTLYLELIVPDQEKMYDQSEEGEEEKRVISPPEAGTA